MLAGGRLVLGPKAERRFGRKNFMELFAVFSSPQSYTVQTGSGQPLGTLNQEFVDRLVDGVSCFLLGGRAWAVLEVRHDDRRVVVGPAPRGRQPTWGGFLPQFLGRASASGSGGPAREERYPYLDEAAAVLAEQRAAMRGVLAPGTPASRSTTEIRWWTFAGGRINSTLRYALEAVAGDWQVIPDNFLLRVRGDDPDRPLPGRPRQAPRTRVLGGRGALGAVAESLPGYRLSKFQPLMPPWVEREVVASYLLDVGGAWRWLSKGEPASPVCPTAFGPDRKRRGRNRPAPGGTTELPLLRREEGRPLIWVRTPSQLEEAVAALMSEPVVGLDVETTLANRTLCLIQWRAARRPISSMRLSSPIWRRWRVARDSETTKLIHYAPFEREVLGRHGSPWTAWSTLARCPAGSAAPRAATASAKSARASSAWNSTRGSRRATGRGDRLPRAR